MDNKTKEHIESLYARIKSITDINHSQEQLIHSQSRYINSLEITVDAKDKQLSKKCNTDHYVNYFVKLEQELEEVRNERDQLKQAAMDLTSRIKQHTYA